MRFVIVTGMSGAGKSTALKILEDVGYFCADNLPLPLLEKFAELACTPESEYNKVALQKPCISEVFCRSAGKTGNAGLFL